MKIPAWLTPVRAAFIGSLLLSLIAQLGSTLNRDGMQYVTTAQVFLDGGFAAAKAAFSWPFLSIAIALFSKITGLGLENAGQLMNALFMAATCALMVACVERRQAEVAWMACLATLALPGLNEYRNELLREYGCWFFIMLSFWLALRWEERPRWTVALGIQAALGVSALFRPEALTLFPALLLWQFFAGPRDERWRRLVMLGTIPIAGGIVLAALYFSGNLPAGSRLAGEFSRISTARFDAKAQVLASALIVYAQEQARTILLFGSLALVPLKLIQKFGLFLVPLAFLLVAGQGRASVSRHPLFAWGIAVHLLVLAVFVIDLQFLAGRYVGLILLFSAPFVGAGLLRMSQSFPRWRIVIVGLSLALMLSNVISTGQGKTHHVEAGKWLATHATESAQVYIDSGRTAYYAGWRKTAIAKRNDRTAIERAVAENLHELFVLEISRKDAQTDGWLKQSGLRIIERFEHPNRDMVIVAVPEKSQP